MLLVHGAFADGSMWTGVITELQAARIDIIAVASPLRSLTSDAAYVASVAAEIDGPVLLAGHDYGGAVITAAVTVAGQQDWAVDLGGGAGKIGGVGREAAQRAGHGDDADPGGLQRGDDTSPHRAVRERAVHEKHGWGAPVSWRH